MKRIGLDRQQHDSFYPGMHYPVTAVLAAGEVRRRGYNIPVDKPGERKPGSEKIKNLVRQGIIETPDEGRAKWSGELIDEACDYLETRQDYNALASICEWYGLTYADWLTALYAAHSQAIDDFGSAAIQVLGSEPDEVHFTCHLEQDRRGNGDARVWFTLRDDVKAEIETARKSKGRRK